MSRELNQYILKEYARLHSVMEQREFMEKVRFLMMAGEKEFSCYYSDASLPVREFYSVADTLYGLNNLWMLSGFLHKNRHILFEEVRERELIKKGAVGYLCGYFLDRDGNKLSDPINDKIIGISFEDLKKVPHVIAVAGGLDKTSAIRAALMSS